MRPNRHEIRVTLRDANGKTVNAPQPLEFTTPALPTERGAFPPIKTNVNQTVMIEPGVTIMSLRREPGQGNNPFPTRFGMLAAVDAAGEVVWYYKSNARISDHVVYL